MRTLFRYINQYTTISEEDFQAIKRYFIQEKLKKKQCLLLEGEICKYVAFIVKGAMRQYYVDEKGVEHVINLFVENWWAGDRESFVMATPSIYSVDAWEDCDVLLISRENVLKLRSQFTAFNELLLKLDERNAIATQRRLTYSISFSAELRYKSFVDNYPYFVARFPQHIIASYLGITKDTLSRVRKKIAGD
ncbi:Crp/Fnr family transcriptional regulator [Parapedobacter deserti]|uniref:Crp/Fnr family transcriptional regulator n=1 Tax=Parapedobacter deserti TaxID=1912957 RepID=A0ABV7JJP6_9SPHI